MSRANNLVLVVLALAGAAVAAPPRLSRDLPNGETTVRTDSRTGARYIAVIENGALIRTDKLARSGERTTLTLANGAPSMGGPFDCKAPAHLVCFEDKVGMQSICYCASGVGAGGHVKAFDG